ncbi:MAG: hypothetical protein ACI8PZ_002604 [Myxococcota bacterium]|jgi:hypothetical protein
MLRDEPMSCALTALLLGCAGSMDVEFRLEGPETVHVQRLGAVVGPQVSLSDGTLPEGVEWDVASPAVAEVDTDGVRALAPGETEVVGRWEGQEVVWKLIVAPALTLSFAGPPAEVRVGERLPLVVEGNGAPLDPELVDWESSDPEVLTVLTGAMQGVSEGTAYVTVERDGSRAMFEVDVTAP